MVKRLLILLVVMTALFATALPTTAGTGSGRLRFWENNYCTGDSLLFSDARAIYTMGHYGWNDEARSLELIQVTAPTTIEVYDSSSGSTSDDYAVIVVTAFVPYYCIPTFERDRDLWYNGTKVGFVDYVPDNGLDGKVSLVRVQ